MKSSLSSWRRRIPCPVSIAADGSGHICKNGRIVHFMTGGEIDCFECRGEGWVYDPAEYLCNACGGSLLPEYPEWWLRMHGGREKGGNHNTPHGLVDASVTGGYDSKHIFDMTTYEWSMCEKCLRAMFETFKIPPRVDVYNGGAEPYEKDSEHYKFRMWERSGAALAWAREGKCNGAFECPNKTTHRLFYNHNYIGEDDSRCEEHQNNGTAMNVIPLSLSAVPGLERVRYFVYDGEDYPWTPEEKAAIEAACRKLPSDKEWTLRILGRDVGDDDDDDDDDDDGDGMSGDFGGRGGS
jgi:hypothetical protein